MTTIYFGRYYELASRMDYEIQLAIPDGNARYKLDMLFPPSPVTWAIRFSKTKVF